MTSFRRLALAIVALLSSVSGATPREIKPTDDLRLAVLRLEPGEELVLGGGTYFVTGRFAISAQGIAAKPVVIRAKLGERPVINQRDRAEDILEIESSRHLVVRGIEFLGGAHGIGIIDSDFVTIEDCEIHNTGDAGIAANSGGTYEGLRLLRNNIHHTGGTGEGMYLGCNYNRCRVARSLVEGNYIHHTNGPTVEQGDGIELKEGSFENIIRDNVIHDTNYAGIITYGTVGNGGRNTIERNVIWNSNDNGIQSAADALIRNNIVLGSPIAMQKHQSATPSNLEVTHNTVITSGDAIAVRNASGPIVIANNAVFSEAAYAIRLVSGDIGQIMVVGNVGAGMLQRFKEGFVRGRGVRDDFVNAKFGEFRSIDLRPKAGSSLIGAGSSTYVTPGDFDDAPRAARADAGAYRYVAGGPARWTIGPRFKTIFKDAGGQ